jgi:hypothetical protein
LSDVPVFTSTRQPADTPLKEFSFSGTTLTENEKGELVPWTETFHVLVDAPYGALMDLASSITITDHGDITYSHIAMTRFLRAVILPSEEGRFDDLIRDKERAVTTEALGAAMFWAAGVITDRPTGPLSGSSDGQRSTNGGSAVEPSSPAETEAGTTG